MSANQQREALRCPEHEGISLKTIHRRIKEQQFKLWQMKMRCITAVDEEYAARMQDMLAPYAAAPDPMRPMVCFDEKPVQLVAETRSSGRMRSGATALVHFEYRRTAAVHLFVFLDAHHPWRDVAISAGRAAIDVAQSRQRVLRHFLAAAESPSSWMTCRLTNSGRTTSLSAQSSSGRPEVVWNFSTPPSTQAA